MEARPSGIVRVDRQMCPSALEIQKFVLARQGSNELPRVTRDVVGLSLVASRLAMLFKHVLDFEFGKNMYYNLLVYQKSVFDRNSIVLSKNSRVISARQRRRGALNKVVVYSSCSWPHQKRADLNPVQH